ncbi:uncharacterized protein LOC110859101 [Folsomia candida]|uniref:uncharacterized protein LOC110859101 n=1 Tax=Folsomia candida TaxID=158441 RepID=UPI000B902B65|nr:uncharacterized protein LOC110859101 [Folsomia candida]
MKYQQEVQILDQFQHLRTTKIMEGGKPSPHSFHLKKVLKSYQLTAANTLSGPSSFLSNGDPASATTAQNSATTPAPSNSSGGNSNSTLIIKTNYVDPNGFIHGNQGGNRIPGAKGCLDDDEVIVVDRDDEQELQQVYLRRRESSPTGNFAMNFSDTSSSTSSTSASPISHHGGGNYEAGVVSPPPPGKGTKSERTSPIRETGGGGRKSSCGQLAPSLPLKKLMHRHSSPPVGGIKEEQQRSLQAAIILASGLQHHHVKNGGDGGGHNHQQGMMQPPPILSASDRSTTEKRETPLEGVFISCFVVGGEKRLCFPHILTTVLKPFSLPQINQVCDELQIFCSRCSPEQLEVLKVTGVLPMGAHSCGLITKTDAERLVNALLHRNPPKAAVGSVAARSGAAASSPNNAFRVYHKCFGKCKGIVLSNLYDRMDSLCIECVECHGLFSPARFVAHSHHRQEVRTCHWGFDSSKWRHYLLLDRDEDPEKWTKSLAEFKGKFEQKRKVRKKTVFFRNVDENEWVRTREIRGPKKCGSNSDPE